MGKNDKVFYEILTPREKLLFNCLVTIFLQEKYIRNQHKRNKAKTKLIMPKLLVVLNVMHCAIWYHLHNLKNVKNTHGGVFHVF